MTSYLQESQTQEKPVEAMRDEDVLRQSLDEPALFEVLMERYQGPLMRAALRIVHGREEAEDIVQEAFVKMYKNAHSFQKLEGIEFKSWAYKIAVNTAITHYRKLKRGEILSEDPAVFEKPSGELVDVRILDQSDAKKLVASALEKIPPHLRIVLKAYYFDDKSYQTIAEEQGISIPTLKMRLFRAKRLFKKVTDTVL